MTWIPVEWAQRNSPAELDVPRRLRIAGTVLRIAFIVCLLAITLRVSMPQNETIWTAYDTPGDLIRILLGFAVCVWIVAQLFRAPTDADGHRTFLYFGLVAIPFALFCLFEIW